MAVPQLVEQVGRVLDGRYRVVAPIGTGASAAVFLADDVTLRRRVAIKVLHAGLASDKQFLRRFQAEAHTAAGLSHPNIMRVLDWGETSDGPFLVLEYLGGGSLRSVLDRAEALTLSQTVKVGIQAARALDYAHRRGLVHRDIKPGNLLFDEEERLAIADFGLARALAEAAWTEPGGSILGTARYASPEQVRGKSLDGKSDVYALGLVLIEAMTGQVPFTADTTLATLMARVDVQLEAPTEMGPLGPIVERATAPDPENRIDAGEMLQLLEAAMAQLPAAEKIELPGAIAIDITNTDDRDATMMPGAGYVERKPTGVSAIPMPIEEEQPTKKSRRERKREAKAAAALAAGDIQTEKKRRRPSVKTTVLAILLVLLLGAVGAGGYALYYFTGTERPVPQLQGLTSEQAQAAATAAEITLTIEGEEFSEDVPAGQTFQQSPGEGEVVGPREAVRLFVSKGPAPRDVQNVVGQTQDAGTAVLQQNTFTVNASPEFSEDIPSGQILRQDPDGGQIERGGTVAIVVSQGPEPRAVPNVSNGSYDAAVAALEDRQLNATRTEVFDNNVPAGQVVGTSPGSGARVARNSTVTVNVSKGPELIQVPNVSGSTVQAATATLTARGFEVNNVYGPPAGTVFDTNPSAGAQVNRGTSVALYTR